MGQREVHRIERKVVVDAVEDIVDAVGCGVPDEEGIHELVRIRRQGVSV